MPRQEVEQLEIPPELDSLLSEYFLQRERERIRREAQAQGIDPSGYIPPRGQGNPKIEEAVGKLIIDFAKLENEWAEAAPNDPNMRNSTLGVMLEAMGKLATAGTQAGATTGAAQARAMTAGVTQANTDLLNRQQALIDQIPPGDYQSLNQMAALLAGEPGAGDYTFSDMFIDHAHNPQLLGPKLVYLSQKTGMSPEDLIDTAAAGGMDYTELDTAVEEAVRQAAQDTAEIRVIKQQRDQALQQVLGTGRGLGPEGRELFGFLGTAVQGLLSGEGSEEIRASLGLGGDIPDHPSAQRLHELTTRMLQKADDQFPERTLQEIREAIRRDPELADYAQERGMDMGNPDAVTDAVFREWTATEGQEELSSRAAEAVNILSGRVPSTWQQKLQAQMFRRLHNKQYRAKNAELGGVAPQRWGKKDEDPAAPTIRAGEGETPTMPPRFEGIEGAPREPTIVTLPEEGEAPEGVPTEEEAPTEAAPQVAQTLPPGGTPIGTEGWADYSLYPDETIRFIHPTSGQVVSVTQQSNPEAWAAITGHPRISGQVPAMEEPGESPQYSSQTEAILSHPQMPVETRQGIEALLERHGEDSEIVQNTLRHVTEYLGGAAPAAPAAPATTPATQPTPAPTGAPAELPSSLFEDAYEGEAPAPEATPQARANEALAAQKAASSYAEGEADKASYDRAQARGPVVMPAMTIQGTVPPDARGAAPQTPELSPPQSQQPVEEQPQEPGESRIQDPYYEPPESQQDPRFTPAQSMQPDTRESMRDPYLEPVQTIQAPGQLQRPQDATSPGAYAPYPQSVDPSSFEVQKMGAPLNAPPNLSVAASQGVREPDPRRSQRTAALLQSAAQRIGK